MPDKIYNGLWWLPNSPEHKVMGRLTVHELGKISLHLDDNLNTVGIITGNNHKVDIIYGEIEHKNGISCKKLITLEEAYGNDFLRKYDVIRAIVPNLYNNQYFEPTQSIINSVQFTFDFLTAWLGGYNDNPTDKNVTFKLDDNNCMLKIKTVGTQDCTDSGNGKILYKQESSCEISFDKPIALCKLDDVLAVLRMFFSLVRLRQLHYFNNVIITCCNDKSIFQYEIHQLFLARNATKASSWFDLLFGFNLVRDNIGIILTNLFEKKHLLEKPITQLYSSLNNNLYIEGQFLNLVSGLEAIHRNFNRVLNIQEDEQLDRIIAKLESLDYNEQKIDIERINEYKERQEKQLHKRIKKIIQYFMSEKLLSLEKLIGNSNDRSFFAHKVANTRNFLVHHDHESKSSMFDFYEQLENMPILTVLLVFSILDKIGFSTDNMLKIWHNNIISSINNFNFSSNVYAKLNDGIDEASYVDKQCEALIKEIGKNYDL